MIGYKDRAFCNFHKECREGAKCERALTEQVMQDAAEWWGDIDAPIAVFIEKPPCFEEPTLIN